MNQKQYESKQEEIIKIQEELKAFDQRQKKIKKFKNTMGDMVRTTVEHKFLYPDNRTVVFCGYDHEGLMYGTSKAHVGDKYEKDLGQIIAVFRAFGVPINKVVKLAEREDATLNPHYHSICLGQYDFSLKV